MTNAIVIADTGSALRRLTQELLALRDVAVVRHYSGRKPLPPFPAALAPDLAIVDEMRWPRLALLRVEELRHATGARIIVRASHLDAGWHADALRRGAYGVVPSEGGVLQLVMQQAIADLRDERTRPSPISLAA